MEKPAHDLEATVYVQALMGGQHGGIRALPSQFRKAHLRAMRAGVASAAPVSAPARPGPEPEPDGLLEIESGLDREPEPTARRYTGTFPRRFRHYYASITLAAGVSITELSEYLGPP